MNTHTDMYAVQVTNIKKAGKSPRYLKGFHSRPEAEDKMNHLYSKDTYRFKVVYIRECINDDGHHRCPQTTITEIPEYYSI